MVAFFRLAGLVVLCEILVTAPVSCMARTDLLTIFNLAEQVDPTYREVQAAALAANEGIPQARADLWLPDLRLTAGAARVEQDIVTDSAFGAGGGVAFSTHQYRIQLTQPVYHHDRIIRYRQAGKEAQQAQYELDSARQDLMVRAAEKYFDALAAMDTLDFARAEKESLLQQLEQARQRFEVGLIAITDVQEAKAGYDLATASEIQAENQLDNTIEALREITKVHHTDLAPLGKSVSLTVPEPADIDAWTETSLQQNLELAAAQIALDIASEEIQAQDAGHLPTLDIVGGHGFNKSGGRFGSTELTQGDVGIELNLPLYQGGRVISSTREAEHRYEEALEKLEKKRRSVYRQTREAFLGITAQISSVKAFEQAVVSSETAVESTRAGFEVGTRTGVDVVTAERGLFLARRDYARARYDYILDVLRLKQAAGTIEPADVAVANGWLESDAEKQ